MPEECAPDNQLTLTISVGIQGVYGFLSVAIYIFNIISLRRLKHNLHVMFRRFYIASACSSCIYFTCQFAFKRLFKLGYFCGFLYSTFKEHNWYIVVFYRVPSTYCPLLLLVLYAFIAFHRVTIVVFPVRARMFWDRYSIYFLAISFLIPILFMWFVIPCRGYAQILSSGGVGFEYERIDTFMGPLSASFFSAIAGIFFGTITLVSTIIIFVNVKNRSFKSDTGMLVFECLMAVFTLIYAAAQAGLYVCSYYMDKSVKEFVEWNRLYFIDLFILPQAWTLLFCNKSVRSETKKIFGFKESSTVVVQGAMKSVRSSIQNSSLFH